MRVKLLSGLVAGVLLSAGAWAQPAGAPGRTLRVTPVVKAYRKASPAVVNISTERPVEVGWRMFGLEDDPFEEFFPKLFRRTVPVTSLGSGFFVHPAGYIVTNAHVVRRARKITVMLSDKSSFKADLVAANSEHDLAVLKIRDDADRPAGRRRRRKFDFLPLGRSDDLMIGETVIAIGNPLGYQNTCTTGVLSALDRKLEFRGRRVYDKLIQIDAPINPGSSGGPLLNIVGELIGINTAIRADAQGIGFAIPVDLLTADFPKLLDFERLRRVVFGLTVVQRHTKGHDELVVTAVAPGSPAEKAKCKAGDRLVAMDGKPLKQLPQYLIPMLQAVPTAKVRLRCLRDGKRIDIEIKVGARPRPDGAALAKGLFGLEFKVLTPEFSRRLRLPVEAGLLVRGVEGGSPAGKLGIRRGDIVFQLGRWYVTDLDKVGAILEDTRPGDALRVGIIRGQVRAWATMSARKPPSPKVRI